MVSFNKVILAGNLTRDPELRYIPSGTALCEFTLAINEKWKDKQGNDKEEVNFIDCVAWAKAAEIISQYMKKGRPLLVEGKLKQDKWVDKATGQNRSKIRVNVTSFQFLGGKRDEESGPPGGDQLPLQAAAPASAQEGSGANEYTEENIPF